MEIKVNVDKQKLKTTTNFKTFVSGSQKFIKFVFHFMDNAWNELSIFAQFTQENNTYDCDLNEDNSVYLPPGIVAGECLLTLYGSNGDVIAVTDTLKLKINENQLVTDIDEIKMSESFYSQLVSQIKFNNLYTTNKTLIGAINELYSKIQELSS